MLDWEVTGIGYVLGIWFGKWDQGRKSYGFISWEELSNPESVQRRGGFQIKQKQKTLERIWPFCRFLGKDCNCMRAVSLLALYLCSSLCFCFSSSTQSGRIRKNWRTGRPLSCQAIVPHSHALLMTSVIVGKLLKICADKERGYWVISSHVFCLAAFANVGLWIQLLIFYIRKVPWLNHITE